MKILRNLIKKVVVRILKSLVLSIWKDIKRLLKLPLLYGNYNSTMWG
jgi:hypothetical protein